MQKPHLPLFLQVTNGIAPVASLVNWVGGEMTYVYGGCIYVLANRTNITSLKDLVNMKVRKYTQEAIWAMLFKAVQCSWSVCVH